MTTTEEPKMNSNSVSFHANAKTVDGGAGGDERRARNGDADDSLKYSTFSRDTDHETDRDRWPSRAAFYLAAVGSAVGFGNVWRFPALAKDFGGGAFFIPYLMALFMVGLPVLMLEIGVGQVMQTGNVGVFGSFHARFRGVGVASVACAYMLVVYYSMLLAWVSRAFFQSFGVDDPWARQNVTGAEAVGYFQSEVIGMETLDDSLMPTRIVGANVGYSFLVWVCIWACLAFGLKWTGRVAYFTMGLPILLLFVFLGKAASLPGSEDGIKEYIGIWDMSVLTERPEVWSVAVSQIFFSLSVTFGTMTAYGSHCPRGEPVFMNSTVIGCSNSMFSFISGFAVFAALGHLSYITGVPVNDIPYSGFSLVFGTWPIVFGGLKGGEHWVRLLFFDLFLLGIDSAFSILEGPITVAMDWIGHKSVAKWKVSMVFSLIAFLLSLIYATDAGLIFLDAVDYYINFVLLLIGLLETFGAGWVYGLERQVESLGPAVTLSYMFTSFGSITLAIGVWFGVKSDSAVWGGFVALILFYLVGSGVTLFFCRRQMQQHPEKWTWSHMIYEVTLSNVVELKDDLASVAGYMPFLWAFMMKHVIPHILLVLFVNLARSETETGESIFGHYGGYPAWPYQVLGILCVVFALFLFLVGAAMPKVFEPADLPYLKAKERTEMAKQEEADSTLQAKLDEGEWDTSKKQPADASQTGAIVDATETEGDQDPSFHC